MTWMLFDKSSSKVKRRNIPVLRAVVLFYILLILAAFTLLIGAAIQISTSDIYDIISRIELVIIGTALSILILILSSCLMCLVLNKMNRNASKRTTFNSNLKILEWEYNAEEWNR